MTEGQQPQFTDAELQRWVGAPGHGTERRIQNGQTQVRGRATKRSSWIPGAWEDVTPNPSEIPQASPDQLLSEISREQFDTAREIYNPIRRQIADEVSDPQTIARNVDRADALTEQSFDVARGGLARNRDRYGLGNDNSTFAADLNRDETLARVGARNTARTATDDRNLGLMNALVADGKGLSTMAAGAASTAAGLNARREIGNQQARAQNQAQTISNVGMGVGLGAYLAAGTAMGGPAGAIIGGGLGLLASRR